MAEITDVNFYIENKSMLVDAGKKGMSTVPRLEGQLAGLMNHGATCYLNALIQCLYHDQDFKSLIFDIKDSKSLMVQEMQKLFASMDLSKRSAISTKNLVSAFGWSRMQMFEQHDIHEFFSVLMDALGSTSSDLNTSLLDLFRGDMKDTLLCPSCSYKRENSSQFINVSIDVPDGLEGMENDSSASNAAGPSVQLDELIKRQLKPETLDADNMWECGQCKEKVQATKFQSYEKLPQLLTMHLKRFRFDPITRRRRKLSTPVYFPELVDADTVFKSGDSPSDAKFGSYRLTSVVIHSGTAMGGHYRALIKPTSGSSAGKWADFNDAVVKELSPSEEQEILRSAAPFDGTNKSLFVHENVYMLVYKLDSASSTAVTASVPSAFVAEVEEDNAKFALLQKLASIRTQLVEFEVFLRRSDNSQQDESMQRAKVEFTFSKGTVFSEACQHVYNEFVSKGLLKADEYPASNTRLRKFYRGLNRLGETYGDNAADSLDTIGFETAEAMVLELRVDSDPPFAEFNPRDMLLNITVYGAKGGGVGGVQNSPTSVVEGAAIAESTDAGVNSVLSAPHSVVELVVPGREHATVKALREIVSEKLKVAAGSIVLISHDDTATVELADDDKELFKDHHILSGSNIFADVKPEGALEESVGGDKKYISPLIAALENKRRRAVIFFNTPAAMGGAAAATSGAAEGDAGEYALSIEVSLDSTLAAVKEMIARKLGVEDPSSFHCKRNALAPQLKDESKTLFELALVDQSVLHLQLGSGCKMGEHMLHFELDVASHDATSDLTALFKKSKASSGSGSASASASSSGKRMMLPPIGKDASLTAADEASAAAAAYALFPLGTAAVSEKATILQLKEIIFNNWAGMLEKMAEDAAKAAAGGSGGTAGAVLPPTAPPTPASPNHLRLRDAKGGKVSGPLRNDRIVGRCLLGLADGRRITVQVLDTEENIGADDLILAVRLASYHDHKALSTAIDLPVTRSDTVKTLFQKVLTLFPTLNEPVAVPEDPEEAASAAKLADFADENIPESKVISIAKGYSSGPPLSLKSALKLKWNDQNTMKPGEDGELSSLDRPPLNLRDGSIIVVRGKADFARAQAAARARRAAAGEDTQGLMYGLLRPGSSLGGRPGSSAGRPGSAAGAGSAAVRAKLRANSKNSKFFENSASEKSLKINPGMVQIVEKEGEVPDRLPVSTDTDDPAQGSSPAAADEAANGDLPPPSPTKQG